jgi:glycosyltransferase involved in cell wall biosynthesis
MDRIAADDARLACLSVVIPVYNEESTLTDVVSRVLTVPYLLEIVG